MDLSFNQWLESIHASHVRVVYTWHSSSQSQSTRTHLPEQPEEAAAAAAAPVLGRHAEARRGLPHGRSLPACRENVID